MITFVKKPHYIFFLSLLLSGCLSMSDKEKSQNIMSTPHIKRSWDKASESNLFATGDWPEEQWWKIFQSPTLDQWIENAFAQNPSLQAVEQKLAQAKEQAKIARSRLFPYLFFDASDNWRHLSEHSFTHLLNPSLPLNGYEVDLSLSFSYEFDFWGKYRNLFKAALGEALAREAEISQAKLILSSALAQSYFALTIHQLKKRLYEQLYQIRSERYELQRKMNMSALSSRLPPLFDEEKVQEAHQWILAIHDEIEIETHFINIMMGESPDQELTYFPDSIVLPEKIPLPTDLSLDLLSRRPDLMAQIWRVEALAYEVGAAKADFFPNINLAAFAGVASTSFQNLFTMKSKSAGYEPAIHLPVFTAGAIRANVRAKMAIFNEAVFLYNDLILKSVQEVTDLLSHITTIYSQKQLQESIVAESQERFFLTELRKEKGLDDSFAMYEFEEQWLLRQIQDMDFLYGQYVFFIKLLKALGGGYKSPLEIPIQARSSP